jgi:anaerobic selenocysteine-containing dehydrogenase
VFDTRLSSTATHADYWIAPYPGSEAAILLAIANYLIQNNLYNREFVETWWNWREYVAQPSTFTLDFKEEPPSFSDFEDILKELYSEYTFEFASKESGVEAKVIKEIAEVVATAGTRFSSHN